MASSNPDDLCVGDFILIKDLLTPFSWEILTLIDEDDFLELEPNDLIKRIILKAFWRKYVSGTASAQFLTPSKPKNYVHKSRFRGELNGRPVLTLYSCVVGDRYKQFANPPRIFYLRSVIDPHEDDCKYKDLDAALKLNVLGIMMCGNSLTQDDLPIVFEFLNKLLKDQKTVELDILNLSYNRIEFGGTERIAESINILNKLTTYAYFVDVCGNGPLIDCAELFCKLKIEVLSKLIFVTENFLSGILWHNLFKNVLEEDERIERIKCVKEAHESYYYDRKLHVPLSQLDN